MNADIKDRKILDAKKPIESLVLSIWLPSRPEIDLQPKLTKLFIQWAKDISPLINLDAPKIKPKQIPRLQTNIWDENLSPLYWGINLEVGKSILFLKSINHLTKNAYNFFHKHDIATKIAVAPNRKCSWAISRYGRQAIKVATKENLRKLVLDFPIECLEINENTLSELREIRVHTIRELNNLRMSDLNERYGIEVSKYLNQLVEGEESKIELPEKEKRVLVQKTLEHPIHSQETFFELIKISLKEICDILRSKHLSSSQFNFSLFFEKQNLISIPYSLSIPLDSEVTIWKILKPRLENIIYEECFSITVIAKRLESKKEIQSTISILEDKENEDSSLKLLTFLEEASGIISEDSVRIYKQEYSHIEEESEKIISLSSLKFILKTNFIKDKNLTLKNNLNDSSNYTEPLIEDRPSIIIPTPLKIEVIKSNASFTFRFKNISLLIKRILGPEIINTNWWLEQEELTRRTRHYYKIQLETGLWIWAYKDFANRYWVLHGIWG